jgi:hypothetical protein
MRDVCVAAMHRYNCRKAPYEFETIHLIGLFKNASSFEAGAMRFSKHRGAIARARGESRAEFEMVKKRWAKKKFNPTREQAIASLMMLELKFLLKEMR